ncbi:MAG TPA: hypothetical protein VN452_06005 [Longilinea sp.]|nr:hypothetical protein [Longilinea sp.]
MERSFSAGSRFRQCFFLISLMALTWLLAGCETTPPITPAVTQDATAECSLTSLTPVATWMGIQDSALLGQLTLANYANHPCPLAGNFELSLLDENLQPMVVSDQSINQNFSIVIQSQQSYQLTFRWQNWCGQIPAGGLTLQVRLSNSSAVLNAALQDPNGQLLNDTPDCTDANQPSRLFVGM